MVIANRRYTDLFEWGQRSVPLSLEAEIQHRLFPGSSTCEAGQFTLGAWLQPAGEIGGDTFDFTLDRDTLHLSMTDVMGHTIEAALPATVLVGGLEMRAVGVSISPSRPGLLTLPWRTMRGSILTGRLVRIDLPAATARIVNAGHPPPFRVRVGHAEQLQFQADPPFGLLREGDHRVQALSLEAGDRLIFVTDGILERDASTLIRRFDGRLSDIHPREAVQPLTQSFQGACGGQLRDDATALCLDWHGGPPETATPIRGQTANP